MAAAISPVYLMLCGLALELLYKAIIVAKGLRVDTNHKLVDFAAQAGLDLSDKEQGLLEILSESVIWAGRYPVAKDFKYMAKLRELKAEHLFDLTPLGKMTIATPNNALNWVSFKELWDRGAELYWQHHSDQ
ncbi:MAG: hypothetical protein HZB55_21835 [Deltaproteobacteria bacterium]|nr:hypothetical protein [Deltaproteobacteria bacterium]